MSDFVSYYHLDTNHMEISKNKDLDKDLKIVIEYEFGGNVELY